MSPALEATRLRSNTLTRHKLSLRHLRSAFKGYSIEDAVKYRALEEALQDIALKHSTESARQARNVLSAYVIANLRKDGIVNHNLIQGARIDLGATKMTTKGPASVVTLNRSEYEKTVDYAAPHRCALGAGANGHGASHCRGAVCALGGLSPCWRHAHGAFHR